MRARVCAQIVQFITQNTGQGGGPSNLADLPVTGGGWDPLTGGGGPPTGGAYNGNRPPAPPVRLVVLGRAGTGFPRHSLMHSTARMPFGGRARSRQAQQQEKHRTLTVLHHRVCLSASVLHHLQVVNVSQLPITGGFVDPFTGGGGGSVPAPAPPAVFLVFDNVPPVAKLATKVRPRNGKGTQGVRPLALHPRPVPSSACRRRRHPFVLVCVQEQVQELSAAVAAGSAPQLALTDSEATGERPRRAD